MLFEPRLRSNILAGKTAIVTGGARGIGGGATTMLAANGAHVVIADVDETKANETATDLNKELGEGTASAFAADLAANGACDQLVEFAMDNHGGVDIVVNAAGYVWDGGLHTMTDEQFQAMLDIHTVVPFRMARATAPIFKAAAEADAKNGERNYRKTVMVSSGAGVFGLPGAGNYAAGKAGVLGLMKTAAKEWGRYNVCVNAIAFGVIRTRFGMPQNERDTIETGGRTIQVGMTTKQAARMGVKVDPDHVPTDQEIYAETKMPCTLGRSGHIMDAGESIFYLCSPLSDYITGQTIQVDGGLG